jgi:hypothetical protein
MQIMIHGQQNFLTQAANQYVSCNRQLTSKQCPLSEHLLDSRARRSSDFESWKHPVLRFVVKSWMRDKQAARPGRDIGGREIERSWPREISQSEYDFETSSLASVAGFIPNVPHLLSGISHPQLLCSFVSMRKVAQNQRIGSEIWVFLGLGSSDTNPGMDASV